jgi:hypothetical protein
MAVKYSVFHIPLKDQEIPAEERITDLFNSTEKTGEALRYWPDGVAAMPTQFSRVALFSVIQRGRRKFFNDQKLESRADVHVQYTGDQLDQADADLWLAILRKGRGLPIGQRMYLSSGELLKETGRLVGGSGRVWLASSLGRLSKAFLMVQITKKNGCKVTVNCHLMSSGVDHDTGRTFIRLDPEGANLFDTLSYVSWETRLALKSEMAKSLQMYICGHATDHTHGVLLESLRIWSGYDGRLRDFRNAVLTAFVALESAGIILRPVIKNENGKYIAQWFRPNLQNVVR